VFSGKVGTNFVAETEWRKILNAGKKNNDCQLWAKRLMKLTPGFQGKAAFYLIGIIPCD